MDDTTHSWGDSRRSFLLRSSLSVLTAGMIQRRVVSADKDRSRRLAPADHCIIVLMTGGPSHLDVWDMKPNAPTEIRGPFQPISTSVPGVQLSEHLPKLATQMHRCSLVRSVHHKVGTHAAAAYVALSGVSGVQEDRPASRRDHPAIGSVIASKRGLEGSLPYVWLPFRTSALSLEGQPIPGILGGFLGQRFDPFFVLDDPSDPDFSVPSLRLRGVTKERLAQRIHLLEQLSGSAAKRLPSSYDDSRHYAVDLLTSSKLRGVFSLNNEPPSVRDRYGDHRFGASLLLARRLVESGSLVVCVSMGADLNNTWDTHYNNFVRLKRSLLPQFDQSMSALITDLADRSMLGRTLVLAFGEFGRTPKIEQPNAGRSHWPGCYSLLMAGGGIKSGVVFGQSDRFGAFPENDPVTPTDIIATAYHCLGAPEAFSSTLLDQVGRPIEVAPKGTPIRALIA